MNYKEDLRGWKKDNQDVAGWLSIWSWSWCWGGVDRDFWMKSQTKIQGLDEPAILEE